MKKHFWKLEYSLTIFALIGLLLLVFPVRFENYFQAGMITAWHDRYDKVSYMFNVIKAQANEEILKGYTQATTPEKREQILLQLIKPYMRLKHIDKIPWRYKQRFKDGTKVSKGNMFYFNELYYSGRQIVGLKDIANNSENDAWFMMMFDINGILPPNRWGKDIYGLYIYDEGKVVPFGYSSSMDMLQEDCSKDGTGIECSYYYIIGGGFND